MNVTAHDVGDFLVVAGMLSFGLVWGHALAHLPRSLEEQFYSAALGALFLVAISVGFGLRDQRAPMWAFICIALVAGVWAETLYKTLSRQDDP